MSTDLSTARDRIAGSIMGAFIGDALGLGPHWYYDLDALRKDYGDWIDTYTDPMPGRYHEGLKAGDLSQTGVIMKMLLQSVTECGGYDEHDFTRRLDEDLLPHLDGTSDSGPGGFTNQSFRELYRARVEEGRPWGATGDYADTSEAAERIVILAARYALDPATAAKQSAGNCRLTHIDPVIVGQSVAFGCIISALIRGEAFDEKLSYKLRAMGKTGDLPFTYATLAEERSDAAEEPPPPSKDLPFPDALLLASDCITAAKCDDIRFEPPWRVAQVYGMACAINFLLPAAYYLTAKFPDDFESAVLHALNGGGQNMSRACMTGALSGALVGLSGIPARFIDGLSEGEELVELARQAARDAVG